MNLRGPGLLAAAVVAHACSAPPAEAPVATWQDQTIGCSDLAQFALAARSPRGKKQQSAPLERKRELLDSLILTHELARLAISAGVEEDPSFQEQWSLSRQRMMVAALGRQLGEEISVEPSEVDSFYLDNPQLFNFPEQRSSRVIVLKLPPQASPELVADREEELLAIRAEFLAGTRFAQLAKRFSEAENAGLGGALPMAPRGELPQTVDKVVWSLEAGEVSQPIRLASGLALVVVQEHLEPSSHSLEVSRQAIERRLRKDKIEARRRRRLAEARERWPVDIDWDRALAPDTGFDEVFGRLSGTDLSLVGLGLTHRPPRLREQIDLALEALWMVQIAEDRKLDEERHQLAARLRQRYRQDLAAAYLDSEAATRVEVSEEELRKAYEQTRGRLQEQERRSFLAVVLPGSEGAMRPVLERAREIQRQWSDQIPALPDGVRLERWGPLLRRQLLSHTSPQFTQAAFELEPGETSPPLRLERYLRTMRFRAEGYVVLRLLEIEPRRLLSLEQARQVQAEWLEGPTKAAMSRLRQEVEAAIGEVEVDQQVLGECTWAAPGPVSTAPFSPPQRAEPGSQPE